MSPLPLDTRVSQAGLAGSFAFVGSGSFAWYWRFS
jgi:hypothetical protein